MSEKWLISKMTLAASEKARLAQIAPRWMAVRLIDEAIDILQYTDTLGKNMRTPRHRKGFGMNPCDLLKRLIDR